MGSLLQKLLERDRIKVLHGETPPRRLKGMKRKAARCSHGTHFVARQDGLSDEVASPSGGSVSAFFCGQIPE